MQNRKIRKASMVMAAVLSIASVSCTLSDSEENEDGSGKLDAISLYTENWLYMSYDNSGRVTEVAMPYNGIKITVQYNPLQITTEIYDTYWDENTDEDVYYLDNVMVMDDVETNEFGYVTSFKGTETQYMPKYNSESGSNIESIDTFHHTLRYDSDGHLTFISDADEAEDSHFEWVDGLLLSSNSTNEARYEYKYDDNVANVTLQWIPLWGGFSPYQMTGLFGKAPSKMITEITETTDYEATYKFAYRLNSAGQIHSLRYFDSDEGNSIVLNFSYVSSRSRSFEPDDMTHHETSRFKFSNPFGRHGNSNRQQHN